MDAAKRAVAHITRRTGHDTEVDEVVNPAITRETVKPHRHEETQEAIDREVHQDHYHTTVQPIQHAERLPEQHSHNMLPVVEKEFVHGDHEGVKRGHAAEIGQFANSSVTQATTSSTSAAAAVTGEHVHHHVHETVQPVIHKTTHQPEVVHTTVPIHETHHAGSEHHTMSALPMKTLDEFTSAGGLLSGSKQHTHEEYDGAPRPYNSKLQTTAEKVLGGITGHHTSGTGVGHTGTGIGGSHTTGTGIGGSHTTGTGIGSGVGSGIGTDHRSGVLGHEKRDSGFAGDHNTTTSTTTGTTTRTTIGDKLNPRVDADRDGKAGIMD